MVIKILIKNFIKNCHQKWSPKMVIKNGHQKLSSKMVIKNCHQCLKGHRSLGSLFNVKKLKGGSLSE